MHHILLKAFTGKFKTYGITFSVAKIKFKKTKRKRLIGRKTKSVYKLWRGTREEMKKFQTPKLHLETSDECCSDWIKSHSKKTRFLVMGKKPKNQSGTLVPTFIVPWSRDKVSVLLVNDPNNCKKFRNFDLPNSNFQTPKFLIY